jgi:hypothetical protein
VITADLVRSIVHDDNGPRYDPAAPGWVTNGHWLAYEPDVVGEQELDPGTLVRFMHKLVEAPRARLVENTKLRIPHRVERGPCAGCECGRCDGTSVITKTAGTGQRVYVAPGGERLSLSAEYAQLLDGLDVVAAGRLIDVDALPPAGARMPDDIAVVCGFDAKGALRAAVMPRRGPVAEVTR